MISKFLLYAFPNHSINANAIRSNGYRDSMGEVEGRFYLVVSTSVSAALGFSTMLLIAVPSYAQNNILVELNKHSISNHVMIAASGNLFAFVAFKHIRARCLLETSAE